MTRTTTEVMAALCAVTQSLPIGTNLALLHFLWMLVSGQLLPSRGALFPGLKAMGLSTAAIRRAWAAFRYGAWRCATLLTLWQQGTRGDCRQKRGPTALLAGAAV